MEPLTSPHAKLRERYRKPDELPLHRTYYYLDGSSTTLTQLTPYIGASQPRTEQLYWHTDAMWAKRIHWPLTRDAWELETHLHQAQDGDPSVPEGWHQFDDPSNPGPLYQSPVGHVFALHPRYDPEAASRQRLVPAPCGVPAPYPTISDYSNILAGQLRHPFFCYLCSSIHPEDNRTAAQCRTLITQSFRQTPGTTSIQSFSHLSRYLFDRVEWKQRNHPLNDEQLAAFRAFETTCTTHEVEETYPPLPLEVFTTPGGLRRYQQDLQPILDHTTERLRLCATHIETQADALDTLIPPGVPVGPPRTTDTLIPGTPNNLSPDTRLELERIQALLPNHPCTLRGEHHSLILEFSKPKRRSKQPVDLAASLRRRSSNYFWSILNTAFNTSVQSARGDHRKCVLHSVDILGLDPAFWRRVSFTGTTLSFVTQELVRSTPQPVSVPPPAPHQWTAQLSFLDSTTIAAPYRKAPA